MGQRDCALKAGISVKRRKIEADLHRGKAAACRTAAAFSSLSWRSPKGLKTGTILNVSHITKPFSPREVAFRIKAQLCRQQYQASQPINEQACLTAGTLTLDKKGCRLYKNKREIGLTDREFLLLSYFMENADKIIGKKRL